MRYALLLILLFTMNLVARSVSYDFEEGNLTHWQRNAVWQITEDKSSEVLSLIRPSQKDAFNLCYTHDVNFTDGNISVLFRANSGKIDQGGGLMWRVEDGQNYYVARFNPLEDNFRFYVVKGGERHQIASANLKLTGGWHTMSITQVGEVFTGYLDGRELLHATDNQLPHGGGVGVWSKADALSSFDDLEITTKEP